METLGEGVGADPSSTMGLVYGVSVFYFDSWIHLARCSFCLLVSQIYSP